MQNSNSQTLKHVGQAIVKESSNKHEAAHVENENNIPNDGDVSHRNSDVCASSDDSVLDQSIRRYYEMSDGNEDDGNIDDCDYKGDENEDEERDLIFLVHLYINHQIQMIYVHLNGAKIIT